MNPKCPTPATRSFSILNSSTFEDVAVWRAFTYINLYSNSSRLSPFSPFGSTAPSHRQWGVNIPNECSGKEKESEILHCLLASRRWHHYFSDGAMFPAYDPPAGTNTGATQQRTRKTRRRTANGQQGVLLFYLCLNHWPRTRKCIIDFLQLQIRDIYFPSDPTNNGWCWWGLESSWPELHFHVCSRLLQTYLQTFLLLS